MINSQLLITFLFTNSWKSSKKWPKIFSCKRFFYQIFGEKRNPEVKTEDFGFAPISDIKRRKRERERKDHDTTEKIQVSSPFFVARLIFFLSAWHYFLLAYPESLSGPRSGSPNFARRRGNLAQPDMAITATSVYPVYITFSGFHLFSSSSPVLSFLISKRVD
jgi:hypothetical protein